MKLLSALIAAVFAVVTFSAVAADAPKGAEELNHNDKTETKPVPKSHLQHKRHKKHKKSHKTEDYPAK